MVKFDIYKASNSDYENIKEINTLKELIDFLDINESIVIFKNYDINDNSKISYSITIYDDYIE